MSLHFLIDGYNLIKRSPLLSPKKLEDGRQGLISFIEHERPQGSFRNPVTVVFDGKPGMYGLPRVGEVKVIFTEYESADDKIKGIVEAAANKREIVVVTDDRGLLLYVRALGAKVLSVSDFFAKAKDAPRKNDEKRRGQAKAPEKEKVITSTFEHKVNQEFEKIWLEKKPKPK